MFTIGNSSVRNCSGITRREMLRVGGLSLAGMTVYAGDHLHNQSAPLQPAVAGAAAAPAKTTTTSTTGRLQLARGVSTTTTRAVTTTHHS